MQENKDPIKKVLGKGKKIKLLILTSALPSLFLFSLVVAIASIIMYPIIKGGQIVAGVAGFWDRLTNTITLKCLFCTDDDVAIKKEEKFYKKVEKLNQTYLNGKGMEGTSIELDIPLLLSVVFYTENIDNTIFEEADAEEQSETENMDDATSGDLFGNLSWYYDQSDQKEIDWFLGATEAEGCYIKGYKYYDKEEVTLGKKSRLRKIAKHMVKRKMVGHCWAVHDDKTGKFLYHKKDDWAVYELDIDRDDSLYTMEFDQQPYKSYRTATEVESLPPTFVTYLISTYLPEQFESLLPKAVKDLSEEHKTYLNKRKSMKNVIYSYKEGYKYLVGNKYESEGSFCGAENGNCSYSVKTTGQKKLEISNVKVKLLQCRDGKQGEPIPGEELVDLETYVTGVLYSENGAASYPELVVHSIAIRSFLLSRSAHMGPKYFEIYQENGSWIVPIRNCTEDQVYCDPNKGCTLYDNTAAKTVRSGKQDDGLTYKPPLSADSIVRNAVASTIGKVLVNSEGEIVVTGYDGVNNNLKKWQAVLNDGGDTYAALANTYGTDKILKSTCTGNPGATANSGSETYYKQGNYSTVPYCSGGKTVATSGCFPTSFAMVVENLTGKVTTPQEIAEYICSNQNGSRKYRVENGSNIAFTTDPATQSYFNITSRFLTPSELNITTIVEKLKSGKKMIVSLEGVGGRFSSAAGHIIVLSGVTPDGKISVLDPGHENATGNHSAEIIRNEVLTHLKAGIIEVEAANSKSETYYKQGDYSTVPYCSGGKTVATSGCFPTSFAMVVENLTGKVTSPQEIAEYICSNKNGSRMYRVDGVGSNIDFTTDPATQSYFNIKARKLTSDELNMTTIVEKLKSGKQMIVSLSGAGGRFSSASGHIIVLSGVTPDGEIRVLDPGHEKATGNHSVEIIKNEVLTHLKSGIIEVEAANGSTNGNTSNRSKGCYTGATGDYIGWRQGDKIWCNIPLGTGGATLKSAGCLATSMAKLLVMSGTMVTISKLNPGTMVQYLNKHGGFSGSNWIWNALETSGLAPHFVHQGSVSLKGKSKNEKLKIIKEYLDQGYYLALQVKADGTEEPGQHWVAVLGVTNTDIVMSDPASNSTNVWSEYKPGGTVQFHYYKKTD